MGVGPDVPSLHLQRKDRKAKMAHFTALDGADSNGVRAEVNVMTGGATIKEIVAPEGSRNAEIIFTPDNPNLKRKVGGYVDKEKSAELYEYAQKAFADQRTIEYRIESQRKRKVDRSITFEELPSKTENVVRILASLDKVSSSEAVTNPKEDPKEAVTGRFSALDQEVEVKSVGVPSEKVSSTNNFAISKEAVLEGLARAREGEVPETIIDAIIAQAIIAGASIEETASAGFTSEETQAIALSNKANKVAAHEEKPWNMYNSDGRPNAGSYMVTHAATAEQFALDHLINLYSQTGSKISKTVIEVTDKMIAQAASIALQILSMADEVQSHVTFSRANRQKNSYGRALNLVIDAILKRFPAPLGGNEQAQGEWRGSVISEASERLYGIMEVAHGELPLSLDERKLKSNPTAPKSENTPIITTPSVPTTPVPKVEIQEEVKSVEDNKEREVSSKISTLAEALGGKVRIENNDSLEVKKVEETVAPKFGEDGFQAPAKEQVDRLRAICIKAGVMGDPETTRKWLAANTGSRIAKEIHAPTLEAWLTKVEPLTEEELKALVPTSL